MPMLHIARCDGPDCGKEESLITTSSSFSLGRDGYFAGSMPSTTHTLPMSWRNVGDGSNAIVCSWACLAKYAQQKASDASPQA